MKWFILLLISFPALAKECALYELKGDVKRETDVTLTVNKDTNSQRVFTVSRKINLGMAPYLDKTVQGKFVIRELEILKMEEVKLVVPDPLFRDQEMKKIKTVSCPK